MHGLKPSHMVEWSALIYEHVNSDGLFQQAPRNP
jgi:hypothetical protein